MPPVRHSYARRRLRSRPRDVYKSKRPVPRAIGPAGRGVPSLGGRAGVSTPGFGFGASTFVKLRYSEVQDVGGAGGAVGYQRYTLNGAYDPLSTAGGHQPMFWDQYAAVYDRYRVHAAKITATFWSETTSVEARVGLSLSTSTTTPTSLDAELERGSGLVDVLPATGTGPATVRMTRRCKIENMLGRSIESADMQATVNTTPALQVYAYVMSQDATEGPETTVVWCHTVINYWVEFFQPKQVAQS